MLTFQTLTVDHLSLVTTTVYMVYVLYGDGHGCCFLKDQVLQLSRFTLLGQTRLRKVVSLLWSLRNLPFSSILFHEELISLPVTL